MQPMELAGVTEALKAELARLRGHIEGLNLAMQPIKPDCALGQLGRMEVLQYQAVQKSELAAARLRLARVKAALSRVAQGSYGYCETCGERIPIERLKACPEALRCTVCADLP